MGERQRTELSKNNPYYISVNRRRELKYFCMQYDEWCDYLKEFHLKYGTGEWMDVTAEEARKRATCSKKKELVEDVCKATSSKYANYILAAVTKNYTDKELISKHKMPLDKNVFQKLRQRFFYLLSQEKHMF